MRACTYLCFHLLSIILSSGHIVGHESKEGPVLAPQLSQRKLNTLFLVLIRVGWIRNHSIMFRYLIVLYILVEITTFMFDVPKPHPHQQRLGTTVAKVRIIDAVLVAGRLDRVEQRQNIPIGNLRRLKMIVIVCLIGKISRPVTLRRHAEVLMCVDGLGTKEMAYHTGPWVSIMVGFRLFKEISDCTVTVVLSVAAVTRT